MVGDRVRTKVLETGLTEKQNTIFMFIKDSISTNQYAPTMREISIHFKISGKAAHDHVRVLAKKGFIKCLEGKSRAIQVLK